jgi:hypothetical protein
MHLSANTSSIGSVKIYKVPIPQNPTSEVQRSPTLYWHNYLNDVLIINFTGMHPFIHIFLITSNTFKWTYTFALHLVSDWMQHNTWNREFLEHSINKIEELTLMGSGFSYAGCSQQACSSPLICSRCKITVKLFKQSIWNNQSHASSSIWWHQLKNLKQEMQCFLQVTCSNTW